ncbi:type VI secretion system tip protein VgrG [Photorhabdus noenieputensis]|uniref:type VI secretion system Vgr family protein n=1 Tax=Photorhabdus noenieputensis TaxID=1208607 RepID=UPI001BD51FF5|nr:type VI secretion system Vgr family protein [Photorhabdus noenieputensis]MBS9439859.1 type VI secretion system tip protein VgrG [Photorhabdus noenieputensis]MCK3667400.1 type VI secretion system tip protein VgrG [Photorhabdus noenieputensis]
MTNPTPMIIFDHSRYRLKVWYNKAPLDVLAFTGQEALSQPFRYAIEFTSAEKGIEPAQMLMQQASFTLTSPAINPGIRWMPIVPPEPLRSVYGVISGFKLLSTSRDESRYEVTLEPRLALMARSHQYAIYQKLSVPEIVEKVLRERHGFRGQDFLFSLTHNYPRREQVMQYGEDDLRFIQRLLAEVGIWYKVTADDRLKIDVVEFYDDQRDYQFNVYLPARNPSGMHGEEDAVVWDMETAYQVVEGKIATRNYDYHDARPYPGLNTEVDVTRGDQTTYGEAYHYRDDYRIPGDRYAYQPETESGVFYARLHHERYLNQRIRLRGMTTSATLVPGQELKVKGDAPEAFRKGAIITQITNSARRDSSFEMAFTAIPYSETVCFRPERVPKPVMAGTIPARVSSTKVNDIYGDIDKDGLYRVSFDFDRAEWTQGSESLWVRLARPYAGEKYGFHWPLLEGTEVAIAFEGGDPDRPYIAHALHDSMHPDHVNLYNYKCNILRTPANNKLRMSDERGREHIKLSTEYGGKSQLNLGHLVDSQRPHPDKRGEGFELRTDDWGAIRAGKGLFISTDEQLKAQGKTLEMQEALSALAQANQQMQTLSEAATQAASLAADVQTQLNYVRERVTQLQTAVLLASSPAGISLVSGEHMQMAAKENLMVNVGKHADIGVMKRLFIGVGEAFGLFVQKLGIKLIANQGKVLVQAQHDEMELMAQQEITLSSSDNNITITTPKTLTLNAGGTYLKMDGGGIEFGTPGGYQVKCQSYNVKQGGASIDTKVSAFPKTELKETTPDHTGSISG